MLYTYVIPAESSRTVLESKAYHFRAHAIFGELRYATPIRYNEMAKINCDH